MVTKSFPFVFQDEEQPAKVDQKTKFDELTTRVTRSRTSAGKQTDNHSKKTQQINLSLKITKYSEKT